MTRKQAKALLAKGKSPSLEVKARLDKLTQQYIDKSAQEAVDQGISREDYIAGVEKAYNAINEEVIRLLMQDYPVDIAINQACGFHANTKF